MNEIDQKDCDKIYGSAYNAMPVSSGTLNFKYMASQQLLFNPIRSNEAIIIYINGHYVDIYWHCIDIYNQLIYSQYQLILSLALHILYVCVLHIYVCMYVEIHMIFVKNCTKLSGATRELSRRKG